MARPIHRPNRAALLAALLLLAAPARADDDRWVWSIQAENDLFGSGLDQHYTHGTRISVQAPARSDDPVTQQVLALADRIPGFLVTGSTRVSYALGQSMFTPPDISTSGPQPDERPYAGWLYAAATVETIRPATIDTLEINLGIVGPDSLADETQIFWHDLIGTQKPMGWDNQLDNEPGVVLAYARRWRDQSPGTAMGWASDMTPHAGINLGNVFTHAAAGATLRIGRNLAIDNGPPRGIRPSLPGSDFFDASTGTGAYVFLGFEARVVARNIFLDGNSIGDSHSVDKKPLVGDLQGGFVINTGRVRIGFSQTWRSREFDGQKDADLFGAVTVSLRF
jgi:lipid A 3-O-deacylase